jgi:pyruvate dehydrogenase E2 component (dihydrolipoamide acetyltransferase)
LEEAEIVEWKVLVGQQIAVNQVVVEIVTAKSLVEPPSPFAGRCSSCSRVGPVVPVGAPIIRGLALFVRVCLHRSWQA